MKEELREARQALRAIRHQALWGSHPALERIWDIANDALEEDE